MSKAIFLATVLPALAVLAQVEPEEPAPGNKYNAGSSCEIAWAVDTTGEWTTLNIELMTGSNSQMVHLTTVATLDGTKDTTFSYTCPEVTINSAIYFYQFSSPAAPTNLTWTGRFAIADASGNTVDPPNEEDGVKYGTGALSDPSTASAAPTYLNQAVVSTTVSAANGTSTDASTVQTVLPTSATGALTVTGSLSSARSTSARSTAENQASGTASGAESSQSAASGASALALDFKSRSLQALAGLVGTAMVFTAML